MTNRTTPVGTVDEELVERLKIQAEVLDAQGRRTDAALARRSATLIEQLLNRVERLEQGLADVISPIGKLRRDAKAEGKQLGPLAYSIGNDLYFVREIARAALTGEHNG